MAVLPIEEPVPTSISFSVTPQEEESPEILYYDLQGRRVTNVTAGGTPALPGIYIRNSKKVYLK